jgi:CDP-diacylglycerol--glycerol-3-phosphate 3-phosphatidyltransferase
VTDRSFVSPATRNRVRGLAAPVALALGRLGLTPNGLTVLGFAGTCVAAVAAAYQQWALAGLLVLGFGIFDLFDGALARATGRASKFGAFLDSTFDRLGENLVLAGVAYGAARAGFTEGALLAVLAMAFASVVTYTRAKAEVIGLLGEVGVAPRPERLILLALGLIIGGVVGPIGPLTFACPADPLVSCLAHDTYLAADTVLALALGLIALLSAVTVVQRILHVKRQLEQGENQ